MIRVFIITLAFFIFFVSVTFASDRISYLRAIMPNMVDYITEVTDYENNGYPLPDIQIVSPQEVCDGAYERKIENVNECDIAGYYNDITNTIYIRNEPSRYMTDDRFQEVVLVHELVHFLQNFNGTYDEVECQQNLESDAYEVQSSYVDLMGIDPKQKPDPLFAAISSLCPNKWPLFYEGG